MSELNAMQVQRIESMRGTPILWRVEMKKNERHKTAFFLLKKIKKGEQISMNRERRRVQRDKKRQKMGMLCLLVGIYDSDVPVSYINEDIAHYLEVHNVAV